METNATSCIHLCELWFKLTVLKSQKYLTICMLGGCSLFSLQGPVGSDGDRGPPGAKGIKVSNYTG